MKPLALGCLALAGLFATLRPAQAAEPAVDFNRDIRPILARNDLASVFDVMVTADDVSTSKPDPTSYRLVVQQLSQRHGGRPLEPEGCVAIEDTPAGIAAAQGAGLRVLAVATTYPAMALGAADRLADSPSRVTRSLLEQVARGIVI